MTCMNLVLISRIHNFKGLGFICIYLIFAYLQAQSHYLTYLTSSSCVSCVFV